MHGGSLLPVSLEGHSMNLYTAPTFNYSAKVQQHGHLPKETRERCKGIAYVQGRAGWGGDLGGAGGVVPDNLNSANRCSVPTQFSWAAAQASNAPGVEPPGP